MSFDVAFKSASQFAQCVVLPTVIDALRRASSEGSEWAVPSPVRAPDPRVRPAPSGCSDTPTTQ